MYLMLKAGFHTIRFCRKDRLRRFKFLEATETIKWKRSSQTTEAILAIKMILAYGSSEIELESISDDPYARIVSIARIASVVWEERFHIIVSVASKNLKRQRRSLRQKRLYGNQTLSRKWWRMEWKNRFFKNVNVNWCYLTWKFHCAKCLSNDVIQSMSKHVSFYPEASRGVGVKLTPPPRFFGFKYLLLYRLSKVLAQLFFVH